MKKLLSIFLIISISLSIILTGCISNNENETSNVNISIDYSKDMQFFYHCAGSGYAPVTKSDRGYYYISKGKDEKKFIIYVDRKTQRATPLCSKPDCMHNNVNTCDAFVNISEEIIIDSMLGSLGNVIQYYDGSLYMICGEYDKSMIEYNTYLMKMDADGSNRKKITGYFDNIITNWFIHKGYFYYTSDSSILRKPLSDMDNDPDVVYKAKYFVKGNENTFDEIYAYKNYIYFIVNEKNANGDGEGEISLCINLDTMEKSYLKIGNNSAYFNAFAGDSMILTYTNNKEKVYVKTDLQGKNGEKVFTQSKNEISSITSDGTYYYFDNAYQVYKNPDIKQTITVYDENMQVVDTFMLPEMDTNTYNFFTPQDEEYFLLENYNDAGEHLLVMADKSQIGSIKGKMIKYKELCSLDCDNIEANQYAVKG